jgi:hypothetical protein
MIQRTGTHVKVEIKATPDANQLGTMANALQIVQSLGAVSREDIIRALGMPGSRNPRQKIKQVDLEKIKQAPEYQLKNLLKYVVEEEEDPAAADFILAMATKMKMKEAAATQGTMNAAMPPRPPGPGGPSPASMPGQSLPGLGHPPGTMGGRPPGTGLQGQDVGP